MGNTSEQKRSGYPLCSNKESIDFRYRLITEPELVDANVREVCTRYSVSRKTWYKWKKRYETEGIKGLENRSRKPHTIDRKVTPSLQQHILQHRAEKLGPRRIRHRLRRRYQVSLSTRTIYKVLKRDGCNLLHPVEKVAYRRFERSKPNELVQMDTLGPFYLKGTRNKNYLIHCLDDHSRRAVSHWAQRKSTREAIATLDEWVSRHGPPDAVLNDNGRQFTSKAFLQYLSEKGIRQIRTSPRHPQTIGKIEAFNKTVKREFLRAETINDRSEGEIRYRRFIDDYNTNREHTGINGSTPDEKFYQNLNPTKQIERKVLPIYVNQTVTHVCKPNS